MADVPAAKLDFPAYVSASVKVYKVMNRLGNARIHLGQLMVIIIYFSLKCIEKSSIKN